MRNAPAEIRLHFPSPAGRLAGIFRAPPDGVAAPASALLCHPHPLYGGTMHNKTLYRIAKRLAMDAGIPSLRFDFRGAGESEGSHDGLQGEVDDTRSALGELRRLSGSGGELAVVGIGYSFGAAVGLRALTGEPDVAQLVALGLPQQLEWDLSFLREARQPLLIVQGEHDEYGSPESVREFVQARGAPTDLELIDGAGHLFTGLEDLAVDAVVRYVGSQFPHTG